MVKLKTWCDAIPQGAYRNKTIEALNPYLTKQVRLEVYLIFSVGMTHILEL